MSAHRSHASCPSRSSQCGPSWQVCMLPPRPLRHTSARPTGPGTLSHRIDACPASPPAYAQAPPTR
eukprot:2868567-Pyramimonas_sp.AAC.1